MLQYSFFDKDLLDVKDGSVRYLLRRNPVRSQEIADVRASKRASVEKLIRQQNQYLLEHPRAKEEIALKKINSKIDCLNLKKWLKGHVENRSISLKEDKNALEEESRLDGCYAIKTDLSREKITAQEVHDRYKDLAMVESAFRTSKSHLEIRPIHVRKKESTQGHVLVVMLAYMIMRELDKIWAKLYLTVDEGLRSLSTLTMLEVSYDKEKTFQQIPEPRDQNKQMLEAADITLPKILPINRARVVTRKSRRKSAKNIES
jgi:transposase